MIEGLDRVLEASGHPGLPELRTALCELFSEPGIAGQLLHEEQLKRWVYRLRFAISDRDHSLVIKRLDPAIAQRNQLVIARWLPAVGLSQCAPRLLAVAAERSGQCVWHIYEDLGDQRLDINNSNRGHVIAAVKLIAQLHTQFAKHTLLPECRLYGGDLGIAYFSSNVRDAIHSLELLRTPDIELLPGHAALRNRLLDRLYKLLDEQRERAQALAEFGGPETLLHGDLWTTNIFVLPTPDRLQALLIDWDRAGVGPISYDLSTLLLRFSTNHRLWILELYYETIGQAVWHLPSTRDLNLLFETAECARYANRVIWPAIALLHERAEWAYDELAAVEQWFRQLEPVLPE